MRGLCIKTVYASMRPSLAKHVRLQIDRVTGGPVLLSQEAVLTFNRLDMKFYCGATELEL
jgi:hypothetical protein